MIKLLKYLLNERGSGGGGDGTSTQRTEYPDPTPEQQQANKYALELAEMQAEEAKRRSERMAKYAPEREKLLQTQIETMKQQMGVSGQAMTALEEALKPSGLQKQREELADIYSNKVLKRLKGEDEELTPQQKERIQALENEFVSRGRGDIGLLNTELTGRTATMRESEGLRPSSMAGTELELERGRQLTRTGQQGRLLSLEQQLNLPTQNLQSLEANRQFQEQMVGAAQGGRRGALLEMAGIGGGLGTMQGVQPTVGYGQGGMTGGTNLSNVLAQMQQGRAQSQSATTYGPPANNEQGAASGAITGAQYGASIGGSTGSGYGALIGGVLGAIGGGIYGYNA
ncbi:MAG: hypothetical protein ABIB11_02965 [Candidatus Omnitrophota bacterium]